MYLSVQLENIRRKHNYLPLIMDVLKILAKRGELVTLCEQVSDHPVRVWTSVTTRGEFFFYFKELGVYRCCAWLYIPCKVLPGSVTNFWCILSFVCPISKTKVAFCCSQ